MPGSKGQSGFSKFNRRNGNGGTMFSVIGNGPVGGKAAGLALLCDQVIPGLDAARHPRVTVDIPRFTVLAADVFDTFMSANDLYEVAYSDIPDDRIAHHFIRASFPARYVGDLRSIILKSRLPLAVRSSSILEDAMFEPFAGIYGTKMIPNNETDLNMRFRSLLDAVKYVYASTFFKSAKNYMRGTKYSHQDEKMGVVIQEVIGQQHGRRFYPHISGVARSYNFYRSGQAKPEDGIVNLALGLGKSIVDGGMSWNYSPRFPRAVPPLSSPKDFLKQTQTKFWAVNLGALPEYDPVKESEHLVVCDLGDAEYDGVLRHVVSTYDVQSDRINAGWEPSGPKIVTFAPILDFGIVPLNPLIRELLPVCEKVLDAPVEIEFAMTMHLKTGLPARLGLLQARPMVVSHDTVDVSPESMTGDDVLLASENVMGNGALDMIRDIVYVKPADFEAAHTPQIRVELEKINRRLLDTGIPYLLIGFGRWGSSDHWLGIPADWGDINGAKVIVEATLPNMYIDLSQGSHFFHNISSFSVSYFSVSHAGGYRINWEWLNSRPAEEDTRFLRHIRLDRPLDVKVDGRTGRGVITHDAIRVHRQNL